MHPRACQRTQFATGYPASTKTARKRATGKSSICGSPATLKMRLPRKLGSRKARSRKVFQTATLPIGINPSKHSLPTPPICLGSPGDLRRVGDAAIAARVGFSEMLAEQKATVGLAKAGRPKIIPSKEEGISIPTLASVGISHKLSSESQKLAAVPELTRSAGIKLNSRVSLRCHTAPVSVSAPDIASPSGPSMALFSVHAEPKGRSASLAKILLAVS
jgi:hypothetical protein